jgi:hypothetical protein
MHRRKRFRDSLNRSKKMTKAKKQIPALTESQFTALFFLFNEGLAANPEISRSPAVMGALHALQQSVSVSVKLPGEF